MTNLPHFPFLFFPPTIWMLESFLGWSNSDWVAVFSSTTKPLKQTIIKIYNTYTYFLSLPLTFVIAKTLALLANLLAVSLPSLTIVYTWAGGVTLVTWSQIADWWAWLTQSASPATPNKLCSAGSSPLQLAMASPHASSFMCLPFDTYQEVSDAYITYYGVCLGSGGVGTLGSFLFLFQVIWGAASKSISKSQKNILINLAIADLLADIGKGCHWLIIILKQTTKI